MPSYLPKTVKLKEQKQIFGKTVKILIFHVLIRMLLFLLSLEVEYLGKPPEKPKPEGLKDVTKVVSSQDEGQHAV